MFPPLRDAQTEAGTSLHAPDNEIIILNTGNMTFLNSSVDSQAQEMRAELKQLIKSIKNVGSL